MLIEDGQGSGRTAGVNHENRLKTITIASSPEHHANHEDGTAYNMLFQQTPAYSDPSATNGNEICFLYMKNTSDTTMIIEGMDLRLGGTGQTEIIEVVASDGETPIGGSNVNPVNLNLGSGNEATGTFQTGNEITGLAKGTVMMRYYVESSHTTQSFNFEQDLIVSKNNTVTLWATNGNNEIDGMIVFFYSEAGD